MAKQTLKTIPKISVRIWRPIIEKLDEKIRIACLRRDAFLNKVLEVELDRLDEKVSIPNSQESYAFVFERLEQLDRKLVSLALSPDLTDRLNEICSRKRIVRDAFFNRIFLLLAASPKAVDTLLFGGYKWQTQVWKQWKDNGPLFSAIYPLEPAIDPFLAIHEWFEDYANDQQLEGYVEPSSGKTIRVERDASGSAVPPDNLYTTVFTQKMPDPHKKRDYELLGLSCYMPDSRIPGHKAEQKARANLDELLNIL